LQLTTDDGSLWYDPALGTDDWQARYTWTVLGAIGVS
jgi:hypothetical protein